MEKEKYLKFSYDYIKWLGSASTVLLQLGSGNERTKLNADSTNSVCLADLCDELLYRTNAINLELAELRKHYIEQGVSHEEVEQMIKYNIAKGIVHESSGYKVTICNRHYEIEMSYSDVHKILKVDRKNSLTINADGSKNGLLTRRVNGMNKVRKDLLTIIQATTVSVALPNKNLFAPVISQIEEVGSEQKYVFYLNRELVELFSPMTLKGEEGVAYAKKYLSESLSLRSLYSKNIHSLLVYKLNYMLKTESSDSNSTYNLSTIADIAGIPYNGTSKDAKGTYGNGSLLLRIKACLDEINEKTSLPKIELVKIKKEVNSVQVVDKIKFVVVEGEK